MCCSLFVISLHHPLTISSLLIKSYVGSDRFSVVDVRAVFDAEISIRTNHNKQIGKRNRWLRWIYHRLRSSLSPASSTETICIVNRRDYNVKLFDILNFVLLYILPLMVMTVSIEIDFRQCSKFVFCFPSFYQYRENLSTMQESFVMYTWD